MQEQPKIISVAPMMDWTDRHCRYFHRLLSPHALLYTEMVTTGALLHGDRDRHLRFNAEEHPVALQLGGNDPAALAECARMGEAYGYDEINLNCGCPSDRVQNGAFGACLMKEPETVAACIAAMTKAVKIPVTVKCRIGVDDCEDHIFLNNFIHSVSDAGCSTFIIHARKAWLQGLSPKENREVPPLNYDLVAEIKARYPHLSIMLNGGLKTIEDIRMAFDKFDGAMIGREAYQNPWLLTEIENAFLNTAPIQTREAVARAMIPYIEQQARDFGTPAKSITRHILGLFNGLKGGRHWRRTLSEKAHTDIETTDLIEEALQLLTDPLVKAA
jgi:tRNA-dihydrouridine synthase A